MFRIAIVFLWIYLLIGNGFSAQPQISLKELMISAERNFKQIHEARNAALALNQPTTIYLPQGIMIDVMGVENGKPVYAVMTNLAHPFEGGYTAFYEQITGEFDLSNARIHYGKKKVIHPDVGFPAERGVTQNELLLIPESTGNRVMAFDAMTGDLVDTNFVPHSDSLSTPIQARQTPWHTISISDQNADVVQEFNTLGAYIGTLAPSGGPDTSIVDNMRGHLYRPNGNLLITVASGANSNAIAEFDSSGNYLGNFIANGAGGLNSPWGISYRGNDILVTGGSAPSGIFRYDSNGIFQSVFAPVDSFPEQVFDFSDINVGVANFSGAQNGVVIFNDNGTFLRTLTGVSGNHGVWQLGNGNVLTTNSTGVHELNYTTGTLIRTVVSGVSARFISFFPGCTRGILGDITGDDVANSTDALVILLLDSGMPLPGWIFDRIGFGDVNENGITNATDAMIILTYDAGIPTPYPVGDPVCIY